MKWAHEPASRLGEAGTLRRWFVLMLVLLTGLRASGLQGLWGGGLPSGVRTEERVNS